MIKIKDKQFVGRWTSKAEPIIYGQGSVPIAIDPNSILVTPREDICPANDDSEAVEVTIGVKYENEDKFYCFNNESYLYQPLLKNTKREFGQGVFRGELTIITLGKKYKQNFEVKNETKQIKDFKLKLTNK